MRKTIAVEIDPPATPDVRFFMDSATRVGKIGADAITVADNPFARTRVDSALLACKLARETGMRAIPHLACRDRNLSAVKSTLLGLSSEGIDTVLAVTGDPAPEKAAKKGSRRAEMNSLDLSRAIADWNQADFPTPFKVGGALNVNARNFTAELARASRKAREGVGAFFTQPVLGEEAAANLRRARLELPLGTALFGGILPIMSYRNARFVNDNLNGISVSQEIIERYRDLPHGNEDTLAVSVSLEMISSIEDCVDGLYLITPFRRIDVIETIVSAVRSSEM